jgi:ribonuclease PH
MSDATARELRRSGGRSADALRPVRIETAVNRFAEGSALVSFGETRVLVTASVERRVPPFRQESGQGWLTAEYAMLPRATATRSPREVNQGRPAGRSQEIQRLVGRSLRAAVDLARMPERTLIVDCDVLQADGGTRTAAITGGYVAVVEALARLYLSGDLVDWPVCAEVAAISVGLVAGRPLLDLDYSEDSTAEVDLNVVGTAGGELIEVQGTGEGRRFSRRELDAMLDLAVGGLEALVGIQREVLRGTLAEVEARRARGPRAPVAPRDERSLWGRP